MKKVKVLKVVEPTRARGFSSIYDYFEVTIDCGNGTSILSCKDRFEYEIFRLEQELLSKGTSAKLLEEYKQAVVTSADFDNAQD